jgi:hypothetical protein
VTTTSRLTTRHVRGLEDFILTSLDEALAGADDERLAQASNASSRALNWRPTAIRPISPSA